MWKNDKICGKGKLTLPNGDEYEGEFLDDKIHGFGKYKNTNGCRYEGYWQNEK